MFNSTFKELATNVPVPEFRGLRILMMPIVFGDHKTVPEEYDCVPMLEAMCRLVPEHMGKVVYLTVDQKEVQRGKHTEDHIYMSMVIPTLKPIKGYEA